MQPPAHMNRYALVLEYSGSAFRGFQKQATTDRTVQAALEAALSRIAAEPVTLVCAGRTDAGVHACQQVVHFDCSARRPDRAWVQGTNTHLPASVRVRHCQPVDWAFHARFSATARTYRYLTLPAAVPSAHLHGLVTWCRFGLDLQRMRQAAELLLGEHDFSSFRSSQCQAKSPQRHLMSLQLTQAGEFLVAEVKANAFLHHMVRNIMGALFEVGRGGKTPQWLREVLEARDRRLNAATAPADGLYLVGVDYPPQFGIPSKPSGPIFLESAATVR